MERLHFHCPRTGKIIGIESELDICSASAISVFWRAARNAAGATSGSSPTHKLQKAA